MPELYDDGASQSDKDIKLMMTKPVEAGESRASVYSSAISVPASGLLAGWAVYEPLAAALNIKSGIVDEVTAGLAIVGTAIIVGARNTILTACSGQGGYKRKVKLGVGAGAAGGITLGIAAASLLDAVVLGGIGTLTAAVIAGGASATGAAIGGRGARISAKKQCLYHSHEGDCCERICRYCGFIFNPLAQWEGVISALEARHVRGDRLSWYDVVSVMHFRSLNYVETVHIFEKNYTKWGPAAKPPGATPTVSRDLFFKWVEVEEETLSDYFGCQPSDHFWSSAEKAVRSECAPEQPIRLEDICTNRIVT